MTVRARGTALWLLLAGVPAIAACNMLTGADDVRLSDDDDDGGSSSASGQGTGAGTGGATAGSGGQVAATGTGGSNAVATTGAGAGPTECDYPAGPYSVAEGGIVPPNLSWQGFVPNSTTVSTISIQDLHDCDGTRGIDAIVIDTSQFG